ncbi:MAG: hypothetical protein QXO75_10560 [Nitrososphaerota archaeon]
MKLIEVIDLLNKCKVIRKHLDVYLQRRGEAWFNPEEFNNKEPLAPIIGTICDEQIKADVAWQIPFHLSQWLNQQGKEFKASEIQKLGKQNLRTWLKDHMHGKWPKKMFRDKREKWLDNISESIINTCKKISEKYNDDPDSIFMINDGKLSIPLVYFILRQFDGIGPKKASMIARDFGNECDWLKSIRKRLHDKGISIEVTDIHFTEVPIDRHVQRVFPRLFGYKFNTQDIQNLARLIYPENPGLVDKFIWELGREVCKNKPLCEKCNLNNICEYYKGRSKR